MTGYWIAESVEGGEVVACWTTEHPGRTGPDNLERLLPELILHGWNVRWVELASSAEECNA